MISNILRPTRSHTTVYPIIRGLSSEISRKLGDGAYFRIVANVIALYDGACVAKPERVTYQDARRRDPRVAVTSHRSPHGPERSCPKKVKIFLDGREGA